jgi:hypothetical protein
MRGWVRMLLRMEAHRSSWSSLTDQTKLANELFGPLIGEQKVQRWFAEQMRLVDDTEFAEEFAGHVQLPGIAAASLIAKTARCIETGQLQGNVRDSPDEHGVL